MCVQYLVLVDVKRPQIRVVEHLGRLDIDGRLPPPLVAQHPLRVDQTPK